MENNLSVLLVEDETYECDDIVRCADESGGIKIIDILDDSDEATESVKVCLPDAVVLDIELLKGNGNGLDFLKSLNEMALDVRPFVLVTTNNTSHIIHKRIKELGADFIMLKYQRGYCAKKVVDFLVEMKSSIENSAGSYFKTDAESDSAAADSASKKIQGRLDKEFDLIGINHRQIGRKYLVLGIEIAISSPDKNIYKEIGEKYGKSSASVERAMQNAVKQTWEKNNIEDLKKYYTARIDPVKGTPTLTEFIYYYVNKLNRTL